MTDNGRSPTVRMSVLVVAVFALAMLILVVPAGTGGGRHRLGPGVGVTVFPVLVVHVRIIIPLLVVGPLARGTPQFLRGGDHDGSAVGERRLALARCDIDRERFEAPRKPLLSMGSRSDGSTPFPENYLVA